MKTATLIDKLTFVHQLLCDDHIQQTKHHMGALGAQDIKTCIGVISVLIEQLKSEEDSK